MRTAVISMLSASLLCLSPLASSAEYIKPGLWEMTTKSDAFKAMPKLSEEQKAQMKKMGVNVPEMSGGAMVQKVCLTKEMVDRDQLPDDVSKQTGCTSKNLKRSGNTYSVDVVCNGPDFKGTGTSKGVSNGTSFTSTYEFKGTAHGQPVNQRHESSGKWLSADCGNVKPMTMPKK